MGVIDLKKKLIQEHSKKQTNLIVDLVLKNEENLKDVFEIIKSNEAIYSQRAAWIVSTISEINAHLLSPYIKDLIFCIKTDYHDAVLRSCFKCLSKITIPKKHLVELFDLNIYFLSLKSTKTGIKCWNIDLAMKLSENFPELQNEINEVLLLQFNDAGKGIRGKMTKTIQKIAVNLQT